VVRQGSAKALCVGSIPTLASKLKFQSPGKEVFNEMEEPVQIVEPLPGVARKPREIERIHRPLNRPATL
jgi:hypothetical protein